jgi:hypothetical protein
MNQNQKQKLVELFIQALDLFDEPSVRERNSEASIEEMLEFILKNNDAPPVQRFIVGVKSFYENQGTLSEKQMASLKVTYLSTRASFGS